MILVVASRFDPAAQQLVSAWKHAEAELCTAEDASGPGWRFEPHDPGSATAVAGGRRVRAADIDAVVTLRPAIDARELAHIVPDDRAFVAAETTAFLMAFLAALHCPVANRAGGSALSGPMLRPEEWCRLAHLAGIVPLAVERTVPGGMRTEPYDTAAARKVFVAGDRVIGDVAPGLAARAVALGRAAGIVMLEAAFTGDAEDARLICASAQPPLHDAPRRALLLSALLPAAVCA